MKFCLFDINYLFNMINIVVIITISFEVISLLVYYFLVMSDIKILKNAKSIAELDKWALKYIKKYNYNKDIVLENINKVMKPIEKTKKARRWSLLLMTICTIIYFMARIAEKMILIDENGVDVWDVIIAFTYISALWAILFVNLTQKRNIVAHEQFSRLFKEEKNNLTDNIT